MTPQRPSKHCHKTIRQVAKAAASELYDTVMADNLVFVEWKRQNPGANAQQLLARFVDRNWPRCIGFARATLAAMLRGPLDEKSKESIMQVLVLDASLIRGRVPVHKLIAPPQ